MKLQLAKGVRDFSPEEKMVRNDLTDSMRKIFERYGFVPLDTPIIERYDVLASKYTGGAEILKEVFTLKDQGERDLCLRYDLTVPTARFVGMNPNVKMPFKRYQMGPVFRDGPIKLGRYREFWQCDVDIIGAKSVVAEAELLSLAQTVFQELNYEVELHINNRKLLNGIIEYAGVHKKDAESVILTIDKLEKLGEAAVLEELKEKHVKKEQAEKIFHAIKSDLEGLKKILTHEEGVIGIQEMEELLRYLKSMGVKSAKFDASLARGLSYYTGTVFEGFLLNHEIKSAVCGGGRYDQMIGAMLHSEQEFPAVGISFGLEVLTDARKAQGKKTLIQVYVIPIGAQKEALEIVTKIREAGINADIDLLKRGVSKNLNYANSLGIPYVAFVGEDEVKQGKVKLRDMTSGDEKLVTVNEIREILKQI